MDDHVQAPENAQPVMSDEDVWGSGGSQVQQSQSAEKLPNGLMSDEEAWSEPKKQPTTMENIESGLKTTANALGGSIADYLGGGDWHNEAKAQFFNDTSAGRIMQSFGLGVMQPLEGHFGIEPGGETEKSLIQSGLINDYVNGEKNNIKGIIGGIALPAAAALDAVSSPIQSIFGGIGGAFGQAEEETGLPIMDALNNAAMSNPEAEAIFGSALGVMSRYVKARAGVAATEVPAFIKEAQATGTIGVDESQYMGLKPLAPEQEVAQAAATLETAKPEPISAPDIHTVARQVDPETFQKYDRLTTQQDDLRSQLSDMSAEREKQFSNLDKTSDQLRDEQSTIQTSIDVLTSKKRLTPANEAKLEDLKNQMVALDEQYKFKSGADTSKMADLRQKIQDIDYQRRDLAPAVSSAYREAQTRIPETEAVAIEPVKEITKPTQNHPMPEATIGGKIANDVSQKLIAAGRPAEEANAAAQLVEEHYAARSQRFGGKLGTPEEMYERDGANIKAGRSDVRAKEFAQNEIAYQTASGDIPKAEKNLSENDRNAEFRLADKVGNHYQDAVKEYNKLPETQGGKILNTDSARELSEDYLKDRTKSAAVHEPASWFTKKLYEDRLKESPKEGETNTVAFTAGGTGAGKSTAVKTLGGDIANSQIIYDTNMNKLSSSVQKIEQALDAGKDVKIAYVYRDPVDALVNGALPRAERMAKRLGSGRTVPLEEHANTHIGSLDVIKQLLEKYKEDPRVSFKLIDNSGGRDGAKLMSIEKLNEITHNDLHGKLSEALEKEKTAGNISEATYKGFRGEDGLGSGASGQPESQRDGRSGDELNQGARGKIRLADRDAKATITLFKSANASTFIHETGHHWLDELMNDANHELAPQGLRADAASVRKWLGAGSEDEITTRQHEKFARGFERYMMEGVAPSKQLAGVFSKFKNWLTQIYQTVQRLRSPITDDIRDVFDRLLSSNPEKTIIAPEINTAKHMADIHEADAIHTPPGQAADVADNIRSEIKSVAKKDTEVSDAIKSAEENSGSTNNLPLSERSGSTEPREGTIGRSDSEVTQGGNSPAPEGTTGTEPRPTDTTSAADTGVTTTSSIATRNTGKSEGTGEQLGTNQNFKRPESNLIDKAGNIRLDNLGTPEDVNTVIRQIAGENDAFMQARRGVIPVGDQLNLADALGMKASDLKFRKIGETYNAEQIIAARKLLIQSATDLKDVAAKAADGDEKDIMAYAEARTRHRMIQEQVAGITAEAGRALGAFRKLQGQEGADALGTLIKGATNDDLFQLQEEAKMAAGLETPSQVSKFINDANMTKWQKFKSMALEYYINCLISGPITHLRYSVGNAISAISTPLFELPAAALSGALRGDEDRVYLGEAKAQLYGMVKGSQDGLRAAVQAFKTGVSPLLPGEHMPDEFLDFKTNAIPGKIGSVINLPSKSVSAIHSFFKSLRYEQNIQGLAYRMAMKEGLDGDALASRIAELTTNPTEEMMNKSTVNSLKELYMAPTDYNSLSGILNRASNSNMFAKIMVPFMKIGNEITKNAFMERTPLGLLDERIRGNVFGSNGGAAMDEQLGKMAFGTALMGGTALMVSQGLMTGDGPENPNQRAIWLLNHTPNSIQIGGITLKYQGLGSLGMLMRFSANMTETVKGWDHEDGAKIATSFMQALTKSVLDENFMRGIKDALDAVYHPEEYAANYIKGFATNWLPYSVGMSQIARQIDPDQREAHTIMQEAWKKVPFESEDLMPRRDRFGAPIPNGASLPQYQNDPVVQRLENLGIGIGKLDSKINGVKLNDRQYDDYSRMAGQFTKTRLNPICSNPAFAGLPPEQQIKTIQGVVEKSRQMARNIVLMQNPTIVFQATRNKAMGVKSR